MDGWSRDQDSGDEYDGSVVLDGYEDIAYGQIGDPLFQDEQSEPECYEVYSDTEFEPQVKINGRAIHLEPQSCTSEKQSPKPSSHPPNCILQNHETGSPLQSNDSAGEIAEALLQLLPNAAFEEAARKAVQELATTVKTTFQSEEAVVKAFGSLLQGAHLRGSDLDICIELLSEEGGSSTNGSKEFQVETLRRLMAGLPPCFALKEARLFKSIRVPIIILEYRCPNGEVVETDISVGSVDEKTKVLKGYTDTLIRQVLVHVPRALPLIRLVKQWAKAQGLNKAFDGFLNSLGWTLLCLYFLATDGELVPQMLHEPAPGFDDESGPLPPPLDHREDQVPSVNDLASFFESMASFEQQPTSHNAGGPPGISLITGTGVTGPEGERSPFYIEDPGVKLATGKRENVGRALRANTWRTILRRCADAADLLRSQETAPSAGRKWVKSLLETGEAVEGPVTNVRAVGFQSNTRTQEPARRISVVDRLRQRAQASQPIPTSAPSQPQSRKRPSSVHQLPDLQPSSARPSKKRRGKESSPIRARGQPIKPVSTIPRVMAERWDQPTPSQSVQSARTVQMYNYSASTSWTKSKTKRKGAHNSRYFS